MNEIKMKKGFSLTEFLVSMVVVAIGLLSLGTLMSISRRSLISNDVRSRGVEYLKEEMELFEELGYETVIQSFHDKIQYDASDGLPDEYTRWFFVYHDDPIPGIVRIQVYVSWRENERTWTVKVETYLTRE
jgi:prepilin-type N-terminal cleavage/methylation domain-containing protein